MKRFIRTFLVDERAATAAEFALVVPVFLLLMFGTINGSIMMSAITQMHYASERAARCLSVDVDEKDANKALHWTLMKAVRAIVAGSTDATDAPGNTGLKP